MTNSICFYTSFPGQLVIYYCTYIAVNENKLFAMNIMGIVQAVISGNKCMAMVAVTVMLMAMQLILLSRKNILF